MSKNKIEITKKEYKELQQSNIKYQSVMAYNHYANVLGYDFEDEYEFESFNDCFFADKYVYFNKLAEILNLTYDDFYEILFINKVIKEDFQWTGEIYSKYKKNINSELGCFYNDEQYAITIGYFAEIDDARCFVLSLVFTDMGAKWVKKNIEKWTSKYLLHKLSQ